MQRAKKAQLEWTNKTKEGLNREDELGEERMMSDASNQDYTKDLAETMQALDHSTHID